MEITLHFAGDVVERQELLNGTETVTLEGASPDGWTLSGLVSWNIGLVDYTGEGDITLLRADGAELYGTLTCGRVTESAGEHRFRLEYEIDDGSGVFDGASGTAEAVGSLSGEGFAGTWIVALSEN